MKEINKKKLTKIENILIYQNPYSSTPVKVIEGKIIIFWSLRP